ncbi:MAG: alpha-amylase family protein [Coraliomargaritaceae bacterium]
MALSRQIHLDFHCSEHIENIGQYFDAESFKECLNEAKVNSINLFAKCHHSWSYYPTNLGKVHPHLNFDLLGLQIKACNEIGIKAFIYFTVGWSANDAEDHPDWCARDKDGSFIIHNSIQGNESGNCTLPDYYWKFMCVNTGYHDLIAAQVKELCELYSVDGFWFDIYQVYRRCYCKSCLNTMKSKGVNLNNPIEVESHNACQIKKHCSELCAIIHEYLPEAKTFFNGTTAIDEGVNFRHSMYENNTIQDLEDLPTTWGGYDKLPMQAKYFLNTGYPITAMSGKFHTAWGEFGGFKHPNALKYEASTMIASGANCNFGDQLHPNGKMDISTYQNIGYAYDYVEKIEDYGIGGMPISRLGVFRSFDQFCDEGLSKILLEKQVDFDIVNVSKGLKKYSTIILPSKIILSEIEAQKLVGFVDKGGSLIILGESISNFACDVIRKYFGIKYLGNSNYDCDYTLAKESLYPIFVKTPFLNYNSGKKVLPFPGTDILSEIYEPYFNRKKEHYCSHQKTPYKDEKSKFPGITRKGNCLFIAHDLDSMYHTHGARIHRDIFHNCLNMVYIDPYIKVDLPSSARINLLHQKNKNRFVLHLLYSTPITRGVATVIEDFVPLEGVSVFFNFPENINSVSLIPNGLTLKIKEACSGFLVTVPKLEMHCALVFHYS